MVPILYEGKNEEAMVCFDKILEIDSKYADALIYKGSNLSQLGKHKEAISLIGQICPLPNPSRGVINTLGRQIRSHELEVMRCKI